MLDIEYYQMVIATLAVCQSFTSHVEVIYNSGFPDLFTCGFFFFPPDACRPTWTTSL